MMMCRVCVVVPVGYGAIGLIRMPEREPWWLLGHCWCCEADYTEKILEEARKSEHYRSLCSIVDFL